MSARTIELKASGAQTADGQGGTKAINTITMGDVVVAVTAASGTVNPFEVYLEGSVDSGTTWYEIPFDFAMEKAGDASENALSANSRNIAEEVAAPAGTEIYMARYKHIPAPHVRLAWRIDGTTPSVTFQAWLLGK